MTTALLLVDVLLTVVVLVLRFGTLMTLIRGFRALLLDKDGLRLGSVPQTAATW